MSSADAARECRGQHTAARRDEYSRRATVRRADEGTAIVMAVMLMTFLGAVGAALVLLTTTEIAIGGHFQSGAEALYAADALVERVRQDLGAMGDWSQALNGTLASTFVDGPPAGVRHFAGGSVDLDAIVNDANCRRRTPCSALDLDRVSAERPWGMDNPRWRVFATGTLGELLGTAPGDAALYIVALVGDDGAENDGAPDLDGFTAGVVPNMGLGVVEVRALAFGSGGTRRVVQVTLARDRSPSAVPSDVRILAWREVR